MSDKVRPNRDFTQRYDEALRQFRAGRFSKARILVATLNDRFPKHLDVLKLGAAIASRSGDYRTAMEYVDQALVVNAGNPGLLAHKASSLVSLRKYQEACATADLALESNIDVGDVLATLGSVYTKCGAHEKAMHCFRRAATLEPDGEGCQYNLGTALRFSGEFTAAEACFDHAIALKSDDYEAYYARSGLRTQTAERNHIDEIKTALAAGSASWRGEVLLRYSLAKELEDLKEWQRSFECLIRGANLRRANMRYDVSKDIDKMAHLQKSFVAEALDCSGIGHTSKEPIFLLGLPRAGSTLVERILAAHSHVTSAGELQNFAVEMMRLVHARLQTTQAPIEGIIRESLQLDFAALGDAYLESTRHITGAGHHFIDKMPQNFLYIGLIHKALPNAKIIHIHRDPMDVCYAMLKTVFKGAYPFSYSLSDLGDYYASYASLMEHWNQCLPGKILNVRYEDMIEDQERTTRELLEFCGLPWDDKCLQFHRLKTPATTASAVDVRRPIYNSSVGKWKNYPHELAELENLLRRHQLV